MEQSLQGKRVLLIVGGGIAAYRTLDLVRRLRERGAETRAILTKAGSEFVTPLSLATLTANKVFTELFDLNDEAEIGNDIQRQGQMGVWGEFDSRTTPQIEILGVTDSAQVVYLDLIYLG